MKPKLCFFMGYGVLFNHERETGLVDGIYGSEIALYNLALELTKYYDVYITSSNNYPDQKFGELQYLNKTHLTDNTYHFNVMIVWRYMHFFVEYSVTVSDKTYLWFHDTYGLVWWNFKELPLRGIPLFNNVLPSIDKVVVLCEWHKENIMNLYSCDESKITIIGNGLTVPHVQPTAQQRVRHQFIWTSCPIRGLCKLVEFFPNIIEHFPHAKLHVYRQLDDVTQQNIVKCPHVIYHGFQNNEVIQTAMACSDFWLYPTDYDETYCISALEAQRAGCICIATARGALPETIEDRGVLLKEAVYTDQYWQEALNAIIRLTADEAASEELRKKAMHWANDQSWAARADAWLKLFSRSDTCIPRTPRCIRASLV